MLLGYEVIITALFVGVVVWVLRSRNPFDLGALFGGFMLYGFDWLWCSRGFWNATVAPDLLMIPGLNILGQRYPITICFIWCIGFGFLPLIASKYYEPIRRTLGIWHLPTVFVVSAIIDNLLEGLCVSVIGVWTYHQMPQYLLLGVPWSNAWFLGGLLTASYFGLAWTRKWASIPEGAGFVLTSENTWKGFLMAAGTILTPAALLGFLQLFWWSASHPWTASDRLF